MLFRAAEQGQDTGTISPSTPPTRRVEARGFGERRSAGFLLKGRGGHKKVNFLTSLWFFGAELAAFSEGDTFMRRRALAEGPRAPRGRCGRRAAASARGSAAPCDGKFDESHLLTLRGRSGLPRRHRLPPLSAANPGRSSEAEAETQLQNTPPAPLAAPRRAPLRVPARLTAPLAANIAFARPFFWFSSPRLRQGRLSRGSGTSPLPSARLTRRCGGEQRSTNTPPPPPFPPRCPPPSRAKMHSRFSIRTVISSWFRAQRAARSSPQLPAPRGCR